MLQLNRAKFSANGSCGYVLKPQCMCQGEAVAPGRGHGGGSCCTEVAGGGRGEATWQVRLGHREAPPPCRASAAPPRAAPRGPGRGALGEVHPALPPFSVASVFSPMCRKRPVGFFPS